MDTIAEDIYTIISKDSKKSIKIDLTTPFVRNSVATIINVPQEDIVIKNSIGEIVETILKKDLLTITEDSVTYYFISLIDTLFDPIHVEGYVCNKLYPLKELGEKEYGLSDGRIITGKDIVVKIKGHELLKTVVDVSKIVNYTNGNYIKRLDSDFTYHQEQIEDSLILKNIIKLNSVSIEKGSVVISDYYSGGENYESIPENTQRFINVNTPEDPNYLSVDEEYDTYIQE